jgi:hypothetical protein
MCTAGQATEGQICTSRLSKRGTDVHQQDKEKRDRCAPAAKEERDRCAPAG